MTSTEFVTEWRVAPWHHLSHAMSHKAPGCSEEAAGDLKFKVGPHKKPAVPLHFFSQFIQIIYFHSTFTLNESVGHVED